MDRIPEGKEVKELTGIGSIYTSGSFKQECCHSPGFLLEHLVSSWLYESGYQGGSNNCRYKFGIASVQCALRLRLISREDTILAQLFPLTRSAFLIPPLLRVFPQSTTCTGITISGSASGKTYLMPPIHFLTFSQT